MPLRQAPGHGDERDETPEFPDEGEKREVLDAFLERLRSFRRFVDQGRVEAVRGGEKFERVQERLADQREGAREKRADATWQRFIEEGFNRATLREFLENIEHFSAAEIQKMIANIDDLIREWDPAWHPFLINFKLQLQAIVKVKQAEE